MDQDRLDIDRVIASYDTFKRRAHEERRRAMADAVASIAPFVLRVGEKAIAHVVSAVRWKRAA